MVAQKNIENTKEVSYSLQAMQNFERLKDGWLRIAGFESIKGEVTEGVLRALGASGDIAAVAKSDRTLGLANDPSMGAHSEYIVKFASPQERELFIHRLGHYREQGQEELKIVDGLFLGEYEKRQMMDKVLNASDKKGINQNPVAKKAVEQLNKKYDLGVNTVDEFKRRVLLEHVLPEELRTVKEGYIEEFANSFDAGIVRDANKSRLRGGAVGSDMEQKDTRLEELMRKNGLGGQPKLQHTDYPKGKTVPDDGDNNLKDRAGKAFKRATEQGDGIGI